MKCKEMPQYLISLLYNEVTETEAADIRHHIEICSRCRKTFQELEGTSQILAQWEDESPDANFTFVSEPTVGLKSWWERLKHLSFTRRLFIAVPALVCTVLVLLAAINFRASYQNGQWDVSVSLIPQTQNADQEARLTQSLDQNQREILTLVSKMISESEQQQQHNTSMVMARFAQEMQERRQSDLRLVGQRLEGLQQTTEGRFVQTNGVLDNLIRFASYQLEKK
ncbi:MAG: zf-HC2 domain-containing protein [Deltaproteobacteria bacterium]|nr:zf-HC2 domain-containing protein [Deltaproteobacteria bacterium]